MSRLKKINSHYEVAVTIPKGIMKQTEKCAVIFHLDNEKNYCIAPLWNYFFEAV